MGDPTAGKGGAAWIISQRLPSYKQTLTRHSVARQISELTRRARTNRLCTRAGMLESFLRRPEALSDDQVMELLKAAFRQPDVQSLLAQMLKEADCLDP